MTVGGARVANNLIFNNTKGFWGEGGGIASGTIFTEGDPLEGNVQGQLAYLANQECTIEGNVVYNWRGPVNPFLLPGQSYNRVPALNMIVTIVVALQPSAQLGGNFIIRDNVLVETDQFVVARVWPNPTGGTWDGNDYFSGAIPSQRFTIGGQASNRVSFTSFVFTTQETGKEITWPIFTEPERTLSKYLESIGQAGSTPQSPLDRLAFLAQSQRRGNWSSSLLASSINAWIRQGFDMANP